MLRIRKNDIVSVMTGKDKGKKGKVLHVDAEKGYCVVEGINFVKKHMRRTSQENQGGIIQIEKPIHISNVALYCKTCDKAVKTGINILKDNTKTRFCKKCKEVL